MCTRPREKIHLYFTGLRLKIIYTKMSVVVNFSFIGHCFKPIGVKITLNKQFMGVLISATVRAHHIHYVVTLCIMVTVVRYLF